MVHGIFSSIYFPFVNFFTAGIICSSLHDILWEATEHLERSDFTVVFQTGDGCGSNHKYYKLHDKSDTPHKAVNVYDPNGRWLYFFSDVPSNQDSKELLVSFWYQ